MTPTFLELCATYSKAHAAHAEALAAAEAAFTGRARVWEQASAEHKAAEVAMEAAQRALLAAVIEIDKNGWQK